MDNLSLAALMDEDREMVLGQLAAQRELSAAQAALEKEIDRVMYRYVERCEDAALRDSAQHILQAMKNTLPVMDTVGEARVWKKQAEVGRKRSLNLGVWTLVLLLGGAVLVLAAVIGTLIGGRGGNPLGFVTALLPALLGGGALFWAGLRAAKPPKEKADGPEGGVRTEYLVDGEKALHCLHGAMLLADGQLARIREENAEARQRRAEAAPAALLPAAELDLLSELLESAYAMPGDAGRESASSIRFYLHNAGIEVVDYQAGRESWFEFLPAGKPGTIRPALAQGGRLVKKGMASSRR